MESQVFHGNCHLVLPKLPSSFVKTVFLDPPYNIGVDYGSGKEADLLPEEEYLSGLASVVKESVRTLTESGSLWFLIPERWADQVGSMLSSHLPRRNRIIWRETFGQYQEYRFPSGHRHLFWHVKDLKRSPFYTDEIRVPSQRMLTGDKRNARERSGEHPCQLPEELLRRIILCSTTKDDIVLDAMAGSGTTLRVAQQLDRQFIGIEEQEAFVQIINERLGRDFQKELFL
jgi:site-specific DNA-methyltransferase (adenine-specific)